MSKKDKLLKRFLSMPKDFTWEEILTLLACFGYELSNSGKTSGSRCKFERLGFEPITMHKPHPGKIIKSYVMKQVKDYLVRQGLL